MVTIIFRCIRSVLSLYTLLLIFRCLMPFAFPARKPWMDRVEQICAPAERLGRNLSNKLFPGRFDRGELGGCVAAILLFFLLSVLLGWMS